MRLSRNSPPARGSGGRLQRPRFLGKRLPDRPFNRSDLRLVFHPLVVFLVASTAAFVCWLLTPYHWFYDWGIIQKSGLFYVVYPWAISFLCFSVGFLLARIVRPAWPKTREMETEHIVDRRVFQITVVLGTMAVIVHVANAVRLLGSAVNQHSFRMANIEGVTTWELLLQYSLVSYAAWKIRGRKIASIFNPLTIALFLAIVFLGIFGGMRILLLVPLLGIFIIFCVEKIPKLTPKFISICCLAALGAFALFAGAEYFRTYVGKAEEGVVQSGPLEFTSKRFLLYFGTAVNSAGAERMMIDQDVIPKDPPFSQTFSPMATLLYQILKISPFSYTAMYAPIKAGNPLDATGYTSPEFTNRWGVHGPFYESIPTGILFWIIWGFLGTTLHQRVFNSQVRPTPFILAQYGLFFAAFLDSVTRVNLLGGIQFLLPFIAAFVLRYILLKLKLV